MTAPRVRYKLAVLGGAVVVLGAAFAGLLALGNRDSNGDAPSAAGRAVACADVTTKLDEEQPDADGARIFRVAVQSPNVPCLLGGDIVLFPNDAVAPGSSTRITLNDTRVLVPELLTAGVTARYRWTNWCGMPTPLFLRAITAFKYRFASGGGYVLTDHSPPCRDELGPSVFGVIRGDAGRAAPPLELAADEGGLVAPACGGPTLAIQSFGPHEPFGSVSIEVQLSSESSCRLFGNVSIELLDATGQLLALPGNPATMPVSTAVGSRLIAIPFQWSSWCGAGDGITVRAAGGGSTVTDSVAVPRCSRVSGVRAGW